MIGGEPKNSGGSICHVFRAVKITVRHIEIAALIFKDIQATGAIPYGRELLSNLVYEEELSNVLMSG